MLAHLPRAFAAMLAGTALASQPLATVAADCQVNAIENATTSFGKGFATTDVGEMGASRKQVTITPPWPEIPTVYLRLRVHVAADHPGEWTIIFRDGDGRYVSSLDQNDSACLSAPGCWTERLSEETNRPKLVASLVTKDATVKVNFLAGVVMGDHGDLTMYSAYPDRPYVDLYSPEAMTLAGPAISDLRRAGDSVGMFSATASRAGTPISWCCSGFALTDDLFMTNWHCGADPSAPESTFWANSATSGACQSGFVDFSWDGDLNKRELQCGGVVAREKPLDYAILRLVQVPGGNVDVPIAQPLEIAGDQPYEGEALSIIHHALCKPKQLSANCSIVSTQMPSWDTHDPTARHEIGHNCSTEGGSSGAPLLNKYDQVVAIQHLGFDCDQINKAVSIRAILGSVRTHEPQVYAEIVKVHPELQPRLQP